MGIVVATKIIHAQAFLSLETFWNKYLLLVIFHMIWHNWGI